MQPAQTPITSNKGIETIVANNLQVPLQSNVADYVLSIAVIHHLYIEERRLQSIRELIRILKPGGKLLIQVWALEQPPSSRRKFYKQDNFVSFNNPEKTLDKKRFYHAFKTGELSRLLECFPNITIDQVFWEVGNWIAIVTKH